MRTSKCKREGGAGERAKGRERRGMDGEEKLREKARMKRRKVKVKEKEERRRRINRRRRQ